LNCHQPKDSKRDRPYDSAESSGESGSGVSVIGEGERVRTWTRTSLCCAALSAVLLAVNCPLDAQQSGKVYRIGYLSNALEGDSSAEIFRQALHDLGYAEEKNLGIEWRFSKGELRLFRISPPT
jgi:hypothetical protein